MPLNKKGKTLLKKFQKEYGKEKGTKVFYAYENKHPELKQTIIDKKLKSKRRKYI